MTRTPATLADLLERVGLAGLAPAELGRRTVERVVEDSRRVSAGDLFVARDGTRVSGVDHVAEALSRVTTQTELHLATMAAQVLVSLWPVPMPTVELERPWWSIR